MKHFKIVALLAVLLALALPLDADCTKSCVEGFDTAECRSGADMATCEVKRNCIYVCWDGCWLECSYYCTGSDCYDV